MPRGKKTSRWGDTEKQAILKGFKEHGWDPEVTKGTEINKLLKSVPEIFEILKPYFGINEGGTKTSNNQLYEHYKNIGSDYLANKGLSGARKRAGNFGEEDNSGDISLGSTDTPPTMKGSAKKAAASATKVPTDVTDNSKKTTGDPELDQMISQMSGMKLSNNLDWGFDFDCVLPYFWWTYIANGERYLKVEVLMFCSWHQDVIPVVSESQVHLIVTVKLPMTFLNVGRLFGYYADPNNNNAPNFTPDEDAMFQNGLAATREIKSKLVGVGGGKTIQAIPLPFKVLSNFTDPYHPEQTGYALRTYPHENNPQNGIIGVTVLSMTMQEAKSTRVAASLDHAHIDVDADTMSQYA